MRTSALFVLACGCNGVLRLAPTELADAAPPDAPRTCAAGVPVFGPHVTQIVAQLCNDYAIAPDGERTFAYCYNDTATMSSVSEGAIDAPLAPVDGIDVAPVIAQRIDPDGNGALVYGPLSVGDPPHFYRYRRTTGAPIGTAWNLVGPVLSLDTYSYTTTQTRGAPPHVLAGVGPASLDELVDDGGDQWRKIATYALADLGANVMLSRPSLTADGLRLIFGDFTMIAGNTVPVIMYTSRASIDDRFSPAVILPTLTRYYPQAGTLSNLSGYLTENCNRFYFTALSSVFYVEQ